MNAITAIKELGDYLVRKSESGEETIIVDLGRSGAQDSDILPHLMRLPVIHWLYLDQSEVTDQVMTFSRMHPELRQLNIADTHITDAGLDFLRFLPDLESISLGSGITDDGIRKLYGLSNLKRIQICQTQVTPDGVAELVGAMRSLIDVGLSVSQISTASTESLLRLPSLAVLRLMDFDDSHESLRQTIVSQLPHVEVRT